MFVHDNRKILVTGASGYVGGRLVPELVRKGYQVRCMARNPEVLKARNWPNIEIVQGDVLKPDTLSAALQNIDTAYYLIHSMGDKSNFEVMDILAAENFGKIASKAGVSRIIYLGGLAKSSDKLSPHLESRQTVGKVLRKSGIQVTELRASIIIGSGSASFEIIRDLAKKLPIMITPRWVRSNCEPIAIKNVIEYLIGCLELSETVGQILEIGGGEIFTYEQMMKIVAELMGKKIIMIPVPLLTSRLSAYWLNIVTSVPMSIAHPLVEGLRNDSVCSDRRIQEWIKLDLLPFKIAVQMALENDKKGYLESRWTEASNLPSYSDSAELKEGIFHNKQIIHTDVSSEKLFQVIQKLGGETGWYFANWLWKLRGLLDRMIGGVGMRRGRRHPTDIRIGDPIDFWRVENYQIGKILKLRAEMKLSGQAWLEFEVKEAGHNIMTFKQTATFLPTNRFGKLYWYLTIPFHYFIFRKMAKNIVKAAKKEIY